jgi:F0F1-type ATP synthase assembly protein I
MRSFIISEIIYWVIALISIISVFQYWNLNRQKAYIFVFFGILSVFMALFRRYFRKKYSNKNK